MNLLTGKGAPGSSDGMEMVRARQTFLASGHYAPLARMLVEQLPELGDGLVLDAGCGTGYYLRAVLDANPDAVGLAGDAAKNAVRSATSGAPRIGGAVFDIWQGLPVQSGSVAAVLNVFAPRNPREFHRVLTVGGALLVLTPTSAHLAELVDRLGLLSVEQGKLRRADAELTPLLYPAGREQLRFTMRLTHAEIAALVGMGPTARHLPEDTMRGRIADLAEPVEVAAEVVLSVYRRRG